MTAAGAQGRELEPIKTLTSVGDQFRHDIYAQFHVRDSQIYKYGLPRVAFISIYIYTYLINRFQYIIVLIFQGLISVTTSKS